jgi:ATP-binding cassette subfamily F protein 3
VRAQLKPLEKQLAAVESKVAKLGREAEAARAALAEPGIYDEAQRARLKDLLAADARLKADLAQAEDDWLHVSAKIEALKAEAGEAVS